MSILIVLFGLLSDCLLSVLVGIIGSSRRIGFGLAFLVSLIFTPLVGLIVALLTDPLPGWPNHATASATSCGRPPWPSELMRRPASRKANGMCAVMLVSMNPGATALMLMPRSFN